NRAACISVRRDRDALKQASTPPRARLTNRTMATRVIRRNRSDMVRPRARIGADPRQDRTAGRSMCLTEPHCGTDLGLLRTRAVPQDDGSYRITGTKIFISAGDHDLTQNILHLVLARLPDAPPGIGGVSLFLVPKFLVGDDGSLG